ncbi:MAG: glycosyltransferase [Planctomycetota bacterium]
MISVIMPAYNAEPYIRQAVDSILGQTLRDYEFIVVDDGSSDATASILRGYAQTGALRLIETSHLGGSAALNLAAREATRPWLAVMHADDEAMPDRLARQLAAAEREPTVVVWGTHGHHINEAGRVLGLSRFGPESIRAFTRDYAAGHDINVLHPSAFLKRDVFLAVGGYDPQFKNCEDMDLFIRMARHGPVLTLPEPLMRYRLHGGSNTMQRFERQCEELRFIRARRQAEMRGQALDFDRFLRQSQRRWWVVRRLEKLNHMSWFHWRNAAMLWGQRRRASACGNLVLATLINPGYCLKKLWRQFASPTARRAIRGASA